MRAAPRLAWPATGLVLVLISCALLLAAANRGLYVGMIFLVGVVACALVGGLIASRRPGSPIGWLFLGSALCFALGEFTTQYAIQGLRAAPGSLPFARAMAWPPNWLWVPGFALVFVFLPLYFPDGRLVSRRWRPVVYFSVSVVAATAAAFAFLVADANDDLRARDIANPFLIGVPEAAVTWIPVILTVLLFAATIAAAVSLISRFRRSGGTQRQQIKWLALAAAATPIAGIVATLASAATPALDPLNLLADLVSTGVPIAVGIAVLEHRLYDIDVIINRALVYGALTVSLGLCYFGGVVSLQYVFRAVMGGGSQLAIVASTLAIAALFSPLRRRMQSFIDRRFYRNKYDAARTLEAFAARLRDETELDTLSDDLVSVARETVQPAHASLWLRTPGREPKEGRP